MQVTMQTEQFKNFWFYFRCFSVFIQIYAVLFFVILSFFLSFVLTFHFPIVNCVWFTVPEKEQLPVKFVV